MAIQAIRITSAKAAVTQKGVEVFAIAVSYVERRRNNC